MCEPGTFIINSFTLKGGVRQGRKQIISILLWLLLSKTLRQWENWGGRSGQRQSIWKKPEGRRISH
jgi:hypothetical protein